MQYASLVAFLSGTLTPEALGDEIVSEVAGFYADLRETKHGFIDVSDGPVFIMTKAAARRLLNAVATQRLSPEMAVYVADCIVASEDIEFADEATREAVSFIEDDSSLFATGDSRLWTPEEISRALATLD
jgi:hypothetical protein